MQTNEALMNEALRTLMVAIAGRDGIKVQFDQRCTTPHASADKVVTMPPPSAVEARMYWVYAFHELGHLLPEMKWTYSKLQKLVNCDDPMVLGIANILVDNFIERNFYGRYEGVDNILDYGRKWVADDWVKDDQVELMAQHPVQALIFGLILTDMEQRQEWAGHLVEAFDTDTWASEVQAVMDALESINTKARIRAIGDPTVNTDTKKADATAKLILDILKLIGYEPPPPQGEGQGVGEASRGAA